jgi:hypothetical protein
MQDHEPWLRIAQEDLKVAKISLPEELFIPVTYLLPPSSRKIAQMMQILKLFMNILCLLHFGLLGMEQKRDSSQVLYEKRGFIKQEDIKKVFFENIDGCFQVYRGILTDDKHLVARKDSEGHIDCYRSSSPYEKDFLGLNKVKLPTYYFTMLEYLFKQQQ